MIEEEFIGQLMVIARAGTRLIRKRNEMENFVTTMNWIYYISEHPDAAPEELHDVWLQRKEKLGWTYGATVLVAKKIHPCMVPYENLKVVDQRYLCSLPSIYQEGVELWKELIEG